MINNTISIIIYLSYNKYIYFIYFGSILSNSKYIKNILNSIPFKIFLNINCSFYCFTKRTPINRISNVLCLEYIN